MKTFALAAALAVGLLGALSADAKGTLKTSKAAVPAFASISGTPLRINIGDDNSFQVFNTTIGGGNVGQIYPSSSTGLADMGWFVRVNGTLTAPSFSDHGTTATSNIGTNSPYGARSVSGVSGTGSQLLPFTVTVNGTAAGGLTTRQTVTYVDGENFFRKAFQVSNPTGAAVNAQIFLASDIYLASSDSGTPFQEAFSGSPGGQTCTGVSPVFTILHISLGTPSSAFTAAAYSNVWSQVGAGALNSMIAAAACIDNGAGLQWNVSIPAGGSVTVQAATSFGDIPGALFGVGEPVWNYSIVGPPNVSQTAVNCVRARFPSNPPTNSFGWAPSEGEFYHENPGNPGFLLPPSGLARAILVCFVQVWDDTSGMLFNQYCWDNPTPWYIGTYPDLRQAQFRIYQAVNGVCNGPTPGTTIFEANVNIIRRLYYPPLPPPPPPLLANGFE